MTCAWARLLVAAALICFAAPRAARAQSLADTLTPPTRPAGSTPSSDPPAETVSPLAPIGEPLPNGPLSLPPPTAPVPYYSNLFNEAMTAPPSGAEFELPGLKLGWFGSVGTGVVKPFIHTNLNSGGLPLAGPGGGFPGPVQLPIAQPNWAAMPDVQLGYRFTGGLGEMRARFQFLSSQGSETLVNFDAAGNGSLSSRLNVDVLDLDYSFTEFQQVRIPRINPLLLIPGHLGLNLRPEDDPTWPPLMMRWAFGTRLANVFFDSQASGQQILNERTTNNFSGAGIRASVDFTKAMPWKPLAMYSRIEGSGVLGKTTQSFTGTQLLPGGGVQSGSVSERATNGVPVLDVETGLAYVPAWRDRTCRMTLGYKFQQWWYLGQTVDSKAELTLQGAFFRAEFGY
jgi:hypothetical protein